MNSKKHNPGNVRRKSNCVKRAVLVFTNFYPSKRRYTVYYTGYLC